MYVTWEKTISDNACTEFQWSISEEIGDDVCPVCLIKCSNDQYKWEKDALEEKHKGFLLALITRSERLSFEISLMIIHKSAVGS